MEKRLIVGEGDGALRLDKLVAREMKLGRAEVKRLFEGGQVRVGRRAASKGEVLAAGSEITVLLGDAGGEAALPDPALPLVILMERDDVVVVDKPAGQPTAPLRNGEIGTLANALVARYPEMAKFGFSPREPGLVHRLDNDTSGVVVAARQEPAFRALTAALKQGKLDKRYLAVCHDNGLPERGDIDIPLAPHPKDRRRVLACLHPRDIERLDPRPALSHYEVKRRGHGFALVEIRAPKALRHQIRAHLAAIECPIAGDTLYGSPLDPAQLGRHALHAASVTWGGAPGAPAFTVASPLPEALEALLDGLAARAGAAARFGASSASATQRLRTST
jgi:23S rRNA pseudouridine1911/1915/1917 synthase